MPEPKEDANLSTTSSVVEAPTLPADSSPAPEGAKTPEQSWEEFTPTLPEPSAPPAAKTEEPVVSPAESAKEPVAPAPEGKKEETPPDDSKLPFHQHPRWQEVIKERDTLKQATEAIKPFVEQQKNLDNYLRSNHISSEQFSEALQFLALRNSNPAEAYNKYVKPLATELGKYEGQVIPQDLQEKVDRGVLTAEDARDWAKQRATAEFTQQRSQQDTQRREEEAQAIALDDWVNQKRKSDADYESKSRTVNAYHIQLVSAEYARQEIGKPGRPTRLPVSTLLNLADEAYKLANADIARWTPAPRPTTTHLSPTTSPPVSKTIPANWDDAVEDLITQYAGT